MSDRTPGVFIPQRTLHPPPVRPGPRPPGRIKCGARHGIAASIHAIAATPNFLIHEFDPTNMGFNPRGIAMMEWSVDQDGYVALPQGVGLGVEMDAKILDEEAKKPQTYKWPGAKLKDGSVADN